MKLVTVLVHAVLINASLGHAASKTTQLVLQHRRAGEPKEALAPPPPPPPPRELSSVTAGVEGPPATTTTTLSLDDFFGQEVKDDAKNDNDLDTFFGTTKSKNDDDGDDLVTFFGTEKSKNNDDDGDDLDAFFSTEKSIKNDDGDNGDDLDAFFGAEKSISTTIFDIGFIVTFVIIVAGFLKFFICKRRIHSSGDLHFVLHPNPVEISSSGGTGMPSSSRDPFFSTVPFTPTPRQDVSADSDDKDDDEPRIFIHPVDEDNRRLHDVSI